MNWYLALDTSTPRSVIVLGRAADGRPFELVASDGREDGTDAASGTLVARIAQTLRSAGVDPGQLAGIGCGEGPGTFTGTRVALATAKGLCFALGCAFYPINTLASVAASLGHEGLVLALLDARRDEVYGAVFDCRRSASAPGVELRSEPRCCPIEAMLAELDAATLAQLHVIGPGVGPYRARLPAALSERAVEDAGVRPEGLWQAMISAVASGATGDAASADAVYLRQSYAELGINKPKRPVMRSPFV